MMARYCIIGCSLLSVGLLGVAGCVSEPLAGSQQAGITKRPAPISHIVFVKLADESDLPALLADSDSMLGTIPTVVSYAAGVHLDTGRPTVDREYSVGIYLGFETERGLAAYVAHPQHVAYVEKWRPRIETLLVRDVIDRTP